jgi:hypothetical protein
MDTPKKYLGGGNDGLLAQKHNQSLEAVKNSFFKLE